MFTVPIFTGEARLAMGLYTAAGGGGGAIGVGVTTGSLLTTGATGFFSSGSSRHSQHGSWHTRSAISRLVDAMSKATRKRKRGSLLKGKVRGRSLLRYGLQLCGYLPVRKAGKRNGSLLLPHTHSESSSGLLLLDKLHLSVREERKDDLTPQLVHIKLLAQFLSHFDTLALRPLVVLSNSGQPQTYLSLLLLAVLLLRVQSLLHCASND